MEGKEEDGGIEEEEDRSKGVERKSGEEGEEDWRGAMVKLSTKRGMGSGEEMEGGDWLWNGNTCSWNFTSLETKMVLVERSKRL